MATMIGSLIIGRQITNQGPRYTMLSESILQSILPRPPNRYKTYRTSKENNIINYWKDSK
jgi:hypothetical protein